MRCGVDEAGRGPLAGPVVAAAVILASPIPGLDDSKRLTERRRGALEFRIKGEARAWAVALASPAEIDALNIHHATLLAMQRAVANLSVPPTECLIDGRFLPDLDCPARALVGGDGLEPAISAASILAKQARDRLMCEYASCYPQYAFDRHKGYPTPAHLAALRQHGPCEIHRRSFAPVAQRALSL